MREARDRECFRELLLQIIKLVWRPRTHHRVRTLSHSYDVDLYLLTPMLVHRLTHLVDLLTPAAEERADTVRNVLCWAANRSNVIGTHV
jgi:hypothetical protein